MGSLSLERVQFKFASIIGELCSEPDVLSQFAVWLDLRLAEYKLKGNISLECSGEEPDPIWLKGLRKGKHCGLISKPNTEAGRQTDNHLKNTSDSLPVFYSGSDHNTNSESFREAPRLHNNNKMSTDPIVVKNEPFDPAVHKLPAYTCLTPNSEISFRHTESRKRFSDFHSKPSSTPPKQRRISQPLDTPAYQSLTSELSHYHCKSQESATRGANSGNLTLHSSPNPASLHLHVETPENSNKSVDLNEEYASAEVVAAVDKIIKGASSLPPGALWIPGVSEASERKLRMRKLRERSNVSKGILVELVNAVESFEYWLWSHPVFKDLRSIEDIQAEALDEYLAEFLFKVGETKSSITPSLSFRNLVLPLDRYLLEMGYPESIKSSPKFRKCQNAFRKQYENLLSEGSEGNRNTK